MKKTIFKSIVLAVVLSIILTTVAFAKTDELPIARWIKPRLFGQIQTLESDKFTVMSRDGKVIIISVGENTRYWVLGQGKGSYEDLETGRWVAGLGRMEDEVMSAKFIVLLPEDFDSGNFPDKRLIGRVTQVETADNILTIKTGNEETITLEVNENTKFIGKIQSINEIEEGMILVAGVKDVDEGNMIATVVTFRDLVKRTIGTIISVDENDLSFSVNTRQDEELIFTVDDNTKFFSRDNTIGNFSDLKPDMVVVVAVDTASEDSMIALSISASNKEQLPEFDLRVSGKVTQTSKDSFSVETAEGDKYTFQLDENTTIRSFGGKLERFFRLKNGVNVIVGADDLEDGSYLAKVVLIRWIKLPWKFGLTPSG